MFVRKSRMVDNECKVTNLLPLYSFPRNQCVDTHSFSSAFFSNSIEWKIIKIEIENPGNNTRPHDFPIAAAPSNKVFYAAKAIKNLYADVVLMCSVLRQGLMLILLHMVLMPFHPKIPLKTFFVIFMGFRKKPNVEFIRHKTAYTHAHHI